MPTSSGDASARSKIGAPRYDAARQMSREMRFQAATVSSHSMILVILVTSSKGWQRERKGVAEANCARDRENKLSPATRHHRATGWRMLDAGRLEGKDDLFRIRGWIFPFFPPSTLSQHACPRIFSYRGEPRSLPFHLALPGTCDDSLSLLQSLRLHIGCRYLERCLVDAVLLAALLHVELQLI